jgi:hypothetical protein
MKKLVLILSRKAREEILRYNLNENSEYLACVRADIDSLEKRFARYGALGHDTCTRNMLKALRMLPWQNSPSDWSRLHVTEGVKVK